LYATGQPGFEEVGGCGGYGLIDPVAEYSYVVRRSVTGGEVVRDPRLPG